jgi:hypothetical protein
MGINCRNCSLKIKIIVNKDLNAKLRYADRDVSHFIHQCYLVNLFVNINNMKTADIRQKLHHYIVTAQDKKEKPSSLW